VGGQRCGVAPGAPAASLAQLVAAAPHLRFAGLQAYHGSAQHVRDAGERRTLILRAVSLVQETQRALRAVGLEARIVSGAGTGTYENEAASGVYNELQCGSYVFMDADYARNRQADGAAFAAYEHALFVYATVMSAPVTERAVVDAGLKALSVDSGMPVPWRLPGAVYHRPSDEHGVLDPHAATRSCWFQATATRPSTCTTGTWPCAGLAPMAAPAWRACGPWPRGAPYFSHYTSRGPRPSFAPVAAGTCRHDIGLLSDIGVLEGRQT
jgi:D-serine deaminase-like pyridoxal phosphate-dependent protein